MYRKQNVTRGVRYACTVAAICTLAGWTWGCGPDSKSALQGDNLPPTAIFEVFPDTGSTEQWFRFDAGGCSDPEDPPSDLRVRWDWEGDTVWDTQRAAAKIAFFQYSDPGSKHVVMEVVDTGLLAATAVETVYVVPSPSAIPNSAPVAEYVVVPNHGQVDTDFVFDSSVSYDAEDPGDSLQVRWDWDDDGQWDESFSLEKIVIKRFDEAGIRTVRLEVVDTRGLTGQAIHSINVTSQAGHIWRINAEKTGDAPTIQDAIDLASWGDEIVLAPGTYTWSNQEASGYALVKMTSEIWLHSEVGPELTILDAQEQGTVILCEGVGSEATIEGLTITGAGIRNAPSPTGIGIYCIESSPLIIDNIVTNIQAPGTNGIRCVDSSPIIVNNLISDNRNQGIWLERSTNTRIIGNDIFRNTGGGVMCSSSDALIRGNVIIGNEASGGGGILCNMSSPLIDFNIIARNRASGSGGGILLDSTTPTLMILNNTIIGNASPLGGGIKAYIDDKFEPSFLIQNNIIAGSTEGYGIYFGPCRSDYYQPIECNVIYGNHPGPSNCALNRYNIFADPMFCDEDAGDYRVRDGSLCAPSDPRDCGTIIGAFSVGCSGTPSLFVPGRRVESARLSLKWLDSTPRSNWAGLSRGE